MMQVSHCVESERLSAEELVIAIAATFTSEPLADSLSFWMRQINLPAAIEFAPYNQVFQQVLDPNSLLSQNAQGINVILLRLEDWARFSSGTTPETGWVSIQRNAQDLVSAIKAAVTRSNIPYLVCFCPDSPKGYSNCASESFPEMIRVFADASNPLASVEAWMVEELKGLSGLQVIQAEEIESIYPVADYYDPERDRLGHIPFTSEFFAALGSILARRIYALKRTPHKVIVLDCDNTLWKGVVGEDGPLGIEISSAWQAVQEFMIAQQQAGMLLCLCSKNNESDVMQVFEQRQDMALALEHLVAWRINWQPKSENIQSLAQELNLGLDSFIFIDDNPVECAEVQANCPEVLALQLPIDGDMVRFLQHVWALDRWQITEEDTRRTTLYKQNLERDRFQAQALTMDQFLSGLELQIEIREPLPSQFSRLAQLTQRTNQFNFTTIRRSEIEIQALLQSRMQCRVVSVRDRFGDYGLVGVMLFSQRDRTLHLDTFLLSCRVLGRGVEYAMIRALAKIAQEMHLDSIEITYQATAKSSPARHFLETIAKDYQQSTPQGFRFCVPTKVASQICNEPENLASGRPALEKSVDRRQRSSQKLEMKVPSKARVTDFSMPQSQRLGRIATELYSSKQILAAIQTERRTTRLLEQPSIISPRTPIEQQLAELWSQLLGIEPISVLDNYFDLGGTSLQAVELFAKIKVLFGKSLPLTTLLEAPTIEALAKLLDPMAANSRGLNPVLSDVMFEKEAIASGQPSLVIPLNQSSASASRLFLIHTGTGEIMLYRNLAQRLQSYVQIYAIKPCSQRGFPILQTRIPEMAAYYLQQIRTVQPQGPYQLGGFCAGGVLAFEIARQLEQQGETVRFVSLFNAVDGQTPKWDEPDPDLHSNWLQRVAYALVMRLWEPCVRLDVKGFKTELRSLLSYAAKIGMSRLKTWLKMQVYEFCVAHGWSMPNFLQSVSVLEVYQFALSQYVPSTRLKGKMLLFRSVEEGRVDQEYVSDLYRDPLLGWGNRVENGVSTMNVVGSFDGILQEPSVGAIARQLQVEI